MISHKINSTRGIFFLFFFKTVSMKCENDESLGKMSGFRARWLKKTNLKDIKNSVKERGVRSFSSEG